MGTERAVFLSSVSQGLEPYREAVYRAIEGLDGYHCVRMEDFGARDMDSDNFCRARVADCDVFVGILGHQYGSVHPRSGKSYTEREYDAALEAGKTRLLFLEPDDFPVQAHLIEDDSRRGRQRAFRDRVQNDRQVTFFVSEEQLASKVQQAIHNCKERLEKQMNSSPVHESGRTWLLFPWVFYSAAQRYDTGVAILNVSQDPSGTNQQVGGITLYFYQDAVPIVHRVSPVMPGGKFTTVLSVIPSMPEWFSGYLIAICDFCPARGIAQLMPDRDIKKGSLYIAELLRREPSLSVPAKD